jgi:hypothetical protein
VAGRAGARPRGAGVTFEHVVAGHQVDDPVRVGCRAVDDRQQVPAGQGMHLAERPTQLGSAVDRLVDAGGGEQRGDEVDVRGRRVVDDTTLGGAARRCGRSTKGTRVASS